MIAFVPYVFLQDKRLKYAFIDSHKGQYSVELMAKSLGVSSRSYYNHKKGLHKTREERVEFIKQNIINAYFNSKGRYGAPRITAELCAEGTPISRETVAKYMSQMGVCSKLGRKFKVATTDSNHRYYIAPNLLNREFDVDQACKTWVTDITYLHTLKRRFCIPYSCD